MSEPTTGTVADTLDRLAAAWNAGDSAAYAAEFTPDASYVAFTGDVMNGRTAIEEVHRWLFEGPLHGSRMVGITVDRQVRYVRPDVAVVVTTGGVQPAEAAELTADRASVQTSTLVVRDGSWLIAAFQNTRQPG